MSQDSMRFKDMVVFIPTCANCRVALINRDDIDAGELLESDVRIYTCRRCKTKFVGSIIPIKKKEED